MHIRLLPAFLLVLGACQSDNDLVSNLPPVGAVNPQPLEDTHRTDVLVQLTSPEIDVLFVVDNSCSMQTSQAELAQNFPLFLEYFLGSGIDYHIGVTSTDMTDASHSGRLRQSLGARWLDDSSPDPEAAFSAMASLGISGSATEQGIAAAYAALELERDDYNAGFRRDDAGLVVVAISDEEDQSGNNPSPAELAAYLEGQVLGGGDVSFSSIVNLTGNDRGDRYIAVTQNVGGITWDITEPDWEPVMDQLGFEALGLSHRFYLSQIPVQDTIDVHIEVDIGSDTITLVMARDTDWAYDPSLNAIVFHEYTPDPLARVVIDYEVLAANE